MKIMAGKNMGQGTALGSPPQGLDLGPGLCVAYCFEDLGILELFHSEPAKTSWQLSNRPEDRTKSSVLLDCWRSPEPC